jgi:hypothetical protein
MTVGHSVEMEPLYGDYPLDQAFDEMRGPGGEVRPQYKALAETLASLPAEELQLRRGDGAHLPLRFAAAAGDGRGVEPH